MKDLVKNLRQEASQKIQEARSIRDVEDLKIQYLGRKGEIQKLMQDLRNLSNEERPEAGRLVNDLKELITGQLDTLLAELQSREQDQRLLTETLDVTLPGRCQHRGRAHPLSHILERVVTVLSEMGFAIAAGTHVDDDYHNFEALNFAKDHPARDMQDTYYLNETQLLRTHMTNLQVHLMERYPPPLRIQAPGVVYRNEEVNARSHVFFHQVDIFYVDKGVTFADLLATTEEFLTKLFPQGTKWRFRTSYFPFVEPGMEVDISCLNCKGCGCALCKKTGWLEIGGAGMIHPEVFKNVGIDPEVYSGYAWGMGIGRLCMLLHQIDDIRRFTTNDLRFLEQFG